MKANPILLQKIQSCYRMYCQDAALDFFYHSDVYRLVRDDVSDMHCMSDE